MKLVHFSTKPLARVRGVKKQQTAMKPKGLWVSDESTKLGWKKWCEDEQFHVADLRHATEIVLKDDHQVLMLTDESAVLRFTERFARPLAYDSQSLAKLAWVNIDWPVVAQGYHGIVITPYQWNLRLKQETFWYYGWDCASGCIWNARAIKELRELPKPRMETRFVDWDDDELRARGVEVVTDDVSP